MLIKLNPMRYTLVSEGNSFEIDSSELQTLDIRFTGPRSMHLIRDTHCFKTEILDIDLDKKSVRLRMDGDIYKFQIGSDIEALIERMGLNTVSKQDQKELRAPMPGLILDVLVNEGQKVEKDDKLIVLEAMKMENILKAEGEGIVKSIKLKKGDKVDKNQVLIELE